MSLSTKQYIIVDHIRKNGSITRKEATELLKDCYYMNAGKYVGEILSNMVNRGHLVRVARGSYKIGKGYSNPASIPNPDQVKLF